MHYEREDLGFSFDFSDGWKRDEHNLTLTFYGPKGGPGITSELIQIQIGGIAPQYLAPASREQFLAEPGAQVLRSRVGDEDNVVVLRRVPDSEISVVRDGIHYTIAHTHDAATEAAIELLKQTARFPSPEMAQSAIRNWADPRKQAVSRVARANSPRRHAASWSRLVCRALGYPAAPYTMSATARARIPRREGRAVPLRF